MTTILAGGRLPPQAEVTRRYGAVPQGLSRAERLRLGREVYPGVTLQPELPPHWVRACLQAGVDPRGRFVWGFPAGCPDGLPLPLTAEADAAFAGI